MDGRSPPRPAVPLRLAVEAYTQTLRVIGHVRHVASQTQQLPWLHLQITWCPIKAGGGCLFRIKTVCVPPQSAAALCHFPLRLPALVEPAASQLHPSRPSATPSNTRVSYSLPRRALLLFGTSFFSPSIVPAASHASAPCRKPVRFIFCFCQKSGGATAPYRPCSSVGH